MSKITTLIKQIEQTVTVADSEAKAMELREAVLSELKRKFPSVYTGEKPEKWSLSFDDDETGIKYKINTSVSRGGTSIDELVVYKGNENEKFEQLFVVHPIILSKLKSRVERA